MNAKNKLNLTGQSDEELMLLYQSGNEAAFQILFQNHQGKIYGYLLKKTNSAELAGDLSQEVFMKIHRSKSQYKKEYPLLPWFFSITHSVLVDSYRKEGKKSFVRDFDFNQMASEESESQSLDNTNIEKYIKQLPGQQKQAIELRYQQEKTFEEIATALNTSPMNVRQLISRGIRQIKNLLKKEELP